IRAIRSFDTCDKATAEIAERAKKQIRHRATETQRRRASSAGVAMRRARSESDECTNAWRSMTVRAFVRSDRASRPAQQAGLPNCSLRFRLCEFYGLCLDGLRFSVTPCLCFRF